MKSLLAHVIIIFIFDAASAQIGAKTQTGKIQGLWLNNDFGYEMNLLLHADGSGEFDGEKITYTVQGNALKINQEGVTTQYVYALAGSSLKVSGGDLEAPVTFIRAGNDSEKVAPNTKTVAQTKTSVVSAAIVGVWSGYGESIEFKNNGQCIYLGQTYPCEISGNHIALQTMQGNLLIPYTINGNQLNLTVNGQQLTYTNGKTSGISTAASATAGVNTKVRDLSLVGKWCYVNVTSTNSGGTSSDQCITIYENGTYEYYSERSMSTNTNTFSGGTSSQSSDRGTWWVEANRIHYNSQTQGQGSYQLEKRNHPKNGDPMIVLDGTTYVTHYRKSPW